MNAVVDRQPLQELEEWDDFVATRYQEGKSEDQFRNYQEDANPRVTEFYRQNHRFQTLQFVKEKKAEYGGLHRAAEKHLGDGRLPEYAGG